jgi:nucleoside-diphosphate-sugar epimerase
MRATVFGASGFFGGHVAEQLEQAGHSVCAVVRATSDRSFLDSLGVAVQPIDYSDSSLVEAMRDTDVVYNCTADTRMHLDEATRQAVEVDLTRQIIRAAGRAGVRRFVQLSTIQVYGPLPDAAVDEDFPCKPVHDYQHAAVAREEVVRREADEVALPWVLVRPVTTTGARDTSLMANLYPVHRTGIFPIIGKGTQTLSMVDARDVARAMVLLGQAPEAERCVFLVSGFDTTWHGLKEALDRATGRRARAVHLPATIMKLAARTITTLTPRGIEPKLHPLAVDTTSRPSHFDDVRARTLGYAPRFTLDDAVGAGAAWVRDS